MRYMSSRARSRTIELISEKLGFSFKEEDLPPKLRIEIGAVATKLDQLWNLQTSSKGHELTAHSLRSWSFLVGTIGLIILMLTFAGGGWAAAVIGLVFLGVAYLIHKQHEMEKKTAEHIKSEANTLWAGISEDIPRLAEAAYTDLSALYEARVRPTIKHITIDFASIVQAAKGRGIILDMIECPNCKGAVKLPKSGDSFECQYCGKIIKATSVFDKLKDIIDPYFKE